MSMVMLGKYLLVSVALLWSFPLFALSFFVPLHRVSSDTLCQYVFSLHLQAHPQYYLPRKSA